MCSEDNVDVHDIELMQYINVDCSKLKRLLQGLLPLFYTLAMAPRCSFITRSNSEIVHAVACASDVLGIKSLIMMMIIPAFLQLLSMNSL